MRRVRKAMLQPSGSLPKMVSTDTSSGANIGILV